MCIGAGPSVEMADRIGMCISNMHCSTMGIWRGSVRTWIYNWSLESLFVRTSNVLFMLFHFSTECTIEIWMLEPSYDCESMCLGIKRSSACVHLVIALNWLPWWWREYAWEIREQVSLGDNFEFNSWELNLEVLISWLLWVTCICRRWIKHINLWTESVFLLPSISLT